MSYFVPLTFAGASLLLIVGGIYAWQFNRQAILNRTLLVFCLLLAIGNFGQTLVFLAYNKADCFAWYRLAWVGWAFYPAVAVQVAILITEQNRFLRNRWVVWALLIPGIVFFVRSQVVTLGVVDFHMTPAGTFVPIYAYHLWDIAYSIYQYGFDLLALAVIWRWGLVLGNHRQHKQAQSILFFSILAILLDVVHYYGGPHGEYAGLWAIEQLFFAFGLTYAITRHKFTAPTTALAADHIVAHVKELVVLTSVKGVILQVNASAVQLLDIPEYALVGQNFGDLPNIHGSFALEWPPCTCSVDTSSVVEITLLTGEGMPLPLSLTCSYLRDSYGDVIGMIIVGEDLRQTNQLKQEIQERIRAETALRAADRAKDRFLATLSHELLTPLTLIFGWIDIARSDPERLEQALDIIDTNAKRQHRLVADLLDVSRMIHGKLKIQPVYFDLADFAVECLVEYRQVAEVRQITLQTNTSGEPIWIHADPIRIRQLLGNLLNNALQYTQEAGTVTVTTSQQDTHAVLAVQDTGCGILPDELPDLFRPFMQGTCIDSTGSLGLGLAVAKGIAELHGGTITVVSPGQSQGSTFTVEFPLAPEGAAVESRC
ncbi:MAG: ATP-binding protein [Armatimonadota bacterium]